MNNAVRCRSIMLVGCMLSLFVFLSSSTVAAPSVVPGRAEPPESPGLPLRQRLAQKMAKALAPASYPATVNILFLKVDFPAASNQQTTGTGVWTDPTYSYNGSPDYWVEKDQSDFIAYYREVSYGLLTINVTVSPKVYRLPNPMSSYGNETDQELQTLVYDSVLSALSDTSNPITNFYAYDAVLIVHAGAGQESDVRGDTSNDIWSLYFNAGERICRNASTSDPCLNGLNSGPTVTLADGNPLHEAIFMPQTDTQDGYTIDPLGVYVHEFGHWLGLPDLYCTAMICSTSGVGRWSLMADGIYNADPDLCPDRTQLDNCVLGSSPAHLDAWSKVFLGWVTPVSVQPPTDLGSRTLNPVETNAEIIRIQASSSTADQYFLLENRQETGLDRGLPGHGLLIWLADDAVINYNLPTNTVNNSGARPGLKLIEADGDWALLAPNGTGSAGDPYPGSQGSTKLTPHSTPSSRPYTPDAFVNIKDIVESGPTGSLTTISADIGFGPLPPQALGMYSQTLVWQPEADPTISGYYIYKNGTDKPFAATATTSYTDLSAQNFDAYRVTAYDSAGDESDFSGIVVANRGGNLGGSGSSLRCFIATAAYGSPLDPHVQALRSFRDRYLQTHAFGRGIVAMYYRYSPPIAEFISRHERARIGMRLVLMPVVYAAEFPGAALLTIACGTLAIIGAYRRRRIAVADRER